MQASTKAPTRQPQSKPARPSWRSQFEGFVEQFSPGPGSAVLLWLLALAQWSRVWSGAQPDPYLPTALAVVVSVYVLLRGTRWARGLHAQRLARSGEVAVGDYFDRLRGLGYRVFHDVPGDSTDIDYVLICTQGVYCIDVARRSIPPGGAGKVFYDGQRVCLQGSRPDDAPIRQSRAHAQQVSRLLRELTGSKLPVRGVVVYPDWAVESSAPAEEAATWVISPKMLPMLINHQPEAVHGRQVRQAADTLAQYLRGYR